MSVSADGARYGVSPLVYSSLDISLPWYFGGGAIYGMRRSDRMMLMSAPMANMAVAKEESALEDSAMPEHVGGIMSKDGNASGMAGKKTVTAGGTTDKAMKPDDGPKLQLRENMQETAFFYPALTTGADGNVNISFTLPESVTTWRFMGIAHDKDMNNVMVENQTVAQKTLMVQPNMPRFVREGDKAVVATRVHNTSAGKIETDVRLTLIDAETMSEVTALTKTISIDANSTEAVNFSLPPMTADRMMVCRITAGGNGFSDGEQHYLPVMPSKELVTNTLPITQTQPGTVNINLGDVMPKHGETPRLTIEYTNNPAWLMVQALPFVANEPGDDAISTMAAYYANALGLDIIGKAPQAKATFAQWRQEKGTETSMMSALEKNQELKQMVLSETPWVADASKESEQKQLLANFFDDNMMQYRLGQAIRKLEALQNSDGSWSWFKGMDGSPHITAQVLEMMARLDILAGRQQAISKMQGRAMQYLGDVVVKEVEEIMRLKKMGLPYNICNYSALQWLYITAISHRDLSAREQKVAIFLLDCMKEQRNTESLHAKAVMAVVLAAYGEKTMAKEYLQSLDEYMVSTPEAGRYYDTPRAAYSWVDYRIPTQVAAMEAFRLVVPESTAVVDDMRRWLLHEKRTQAWATPINSVNAIYAFLCGNSSALQGGEKSVISLDGKALPLPKATAGMGYVKTQVDAEGKKTLSVKKTSKGTSWGAVYAQAWQQTSDVESRGQGMSVKREVMVSGKAVDNNAKSQGGDARSLNVGDKVKVRITIQADRDYDFVQVSDRRAACMEPVSQLSGYGWGYYISPKDNVTNYYFDFMSKGTHVIETEYYIDRPGTYTTGTCQVQCTYAPEFTAREGAKVVRVE